jgi:hypothetical protein
MSRERIHHLFDHAKKIIAARDASSDELFRFTQQCVEMTGISGELHYLPEAEKNSVREKLRVIQADIHELSENKKADERLASFRTVPDLIAKAEERYVLSQEELSILRDAAHLEPGQGGFYVRFLIAVSGENSNNNDLEWLGSAAGEENNTVLQSRANSLAFGRRRASIEDIRHALAQEYGRQEKFFLEQKRAYEQTYPKMLETYEHVKHIADASYILWNLFKDRGIVSTSKNIPNREGTSVRDALVAVFKILSGNTFDGKKIPPMEVEEFYKLADACISGDETIIAEWKNNVAAFQEEKEQERAREKEASVQRKEKPEIDIINSAEWVTTQATAIERIISERSFWLVQNFTFVCKEVHAHKSASRFVVVFQGLGKDFEIDLDGLYDPSDSKSWGRPWEKKFFSYRVGEAAIAVLSAKLAPVFEKIKKDVEEKKRVIAEQQEKRNKQQEEAKRQQEVLLVEAFALQKQQNDMVWEQSVPSLLAQRDHLLSRMALSDDDLYAHGLSHSILDKLSRELKMAERHIPTRDTFDPKKHNFNEAQRILSDIDRILNTSLGREKESLPEPSTPLEQEVRDAQHDVLKTKKEFEIYGAAGSNLEIARVLAGTIMEKVGMRKAFELLTNICNASYGRGGKQKDIEDILGKGSGVPASIQDFYLFSKARDVESVLEAARRILEKGDTKDMTLSVVSQPAVLVPTHDISQPVDGGILTQALDTLKTLFGSAPSRDVPVSEKKQSGGGYKTPEKNVGREKTEQETRAFQENLDLFEALLENIPLRTTDKKNPRDSAAFEKITEKRNRLLDRIMIFRQDIEQLPSDATNLILTSMQGKIVGLRGDVHQLILSREVAIDLKKTDIVHDWRQQVETLWTQIPTVLKQDVGDLIPAESIPIVVKKARIELLKQVKHIQAGRDIGLKNLIEDIAQQYME